MATLREEFRKALVALLVNAAQGKGPTKVKSGVELDPLSTELAELVIEEERFVINLNSGKCYHLRTATAISKVSKFIGPKLSIQVESNAPGYPYFLSLFKQLATHKLSYNLYLAIQNQLSSMPSTWIGAVFREPTLLLKLGRLNTTGAHTLSYLLRKQLAHYSLEGLKSSDDNHLQNKLLGLKECVLSLNQQIKDLLQVNGRLTEKIKELSSENYALKKTLKQATDKTQLHEAQAQIDVLTEEKNKLVQQLEQVHKNAETAIAKIAALEEALSVSKQENEALRVLLVSLNEQNELIKNVLQSVTYEMEQSLEEKMDQYDIENRAVTPSSQFPLNPSEHHLSRDDINAQFRRYRGKSQSYEPRNLWKKESRPESELRSAGFESKTI